MEPGMMQDGTPQADTSTGRRFERIPLAEFITEMQDEALASHLSAMQDQLGRVEALLEKQAAAPGNGEAEAKPRDRMGLEPEDRKETFTTDELAERIRSHEG